MKPLRLNIGITLESESVTALLAFMRQAVEQRPEDRTNNPIVGQPKMTPIEASQNALFGGQKPSDNLGLLVDSKEVSKLLKVSSRTIWSMLATGRMLKPIRIGRSVRWSYDEIKAWVEAGCPHRDRWTWKRE